MPGTFAIDAVREGRTQVCAGGGRIFIVHVFDVEFTILEAEGVPNGSPGSGSFTMIDVVDEVSGRILERIDVRADVEGITPGARWVGLGGSDLAFTGYRVAPAGNMERYLALASRQ